MERRHLLRMGAAATAAGLLKFASAQSKPPSGIMIGMSFTDNPKEEDLALLRHNGVEAVSIWTTIANNNAEWMTAMRKRLDANGVKIYNIGIIDLHCDPTLVLGTAGVETKIQQYKDYLANLSRAGIHYTTYAHMANIKNQPIPGFYATAMGKARGNSPTREFDVAVARKLPNSFDKEYPADHIWKTFTTFIRAVVPVAEKNNVKIGLHPDDPPVSPLGGVARIFTNYSAYEKAFEIANSPNFGACLCVGTWGEGGKDMGRDPIAAALAFGAKKKLFKIHFRNVTSPLPKFREAFVDDGYMDLYKVMKALRKV
ncbi:MAG TPA: mannonate dehydratase, partial [Bryobacteraceae bacterium]|nr:mannonate dehydratase [Bryobacteraceae bacterium]